MKKIKNNYTNFILTVIAIAMIGILFKGEKIITSAHAIEKHQHNYTDILAKELATGEIKDFMWLVKLVITSDCGVQIRQTTFGHNGIISCR